MLSLRDWAFTATRMPGAAATSAAATGLTGALREVWNNTADVGVAFLGSWLQAGDESASGLDKKALGSAQHASHSFKLDNKACMWRGAVF
jgi:hypothetical protein